MSLLFRTHEMNVEYMKFTYHDGTKKINGYLEKSSYPVISHLRDRLHVSIFEEHKQQRSELRLYWIDEDGDEISIMNQNDYDIFLTRPRQLHIVPIKENPEEPTVTKQKATSSGAPPPYEDEFPIVHENVICDSCDLDPIIGFRYKCIQCPNFDLCQSCEAQHKHGDHMMVRMPNPNCPSVVEAWISGRYGRRSSKRAARNQCPFMPEPQATEACNRAAEKEAREKERETHRQQRHHRRQMRNGLFSNLYDMMQDLAEGGTAAAAAEGAKAEAANAAAQEAAQAAKFAATKAAEAAVNGAQVVAKVAEAAAAAAAHDIAQACASASASAATAVGPFAEAEQSSDKKSPTTPPKENNNNNIDEPRVEAKQSPTNDTAIPVISMPSLENLAQYIDPEYMKAGIQILNNFSEMFAKMLDPADGAGSPCSFQNGANPSEERKNSTASATSSTSSSTYKKCGKTINNINKTVTENKKTETATPQKEDKGINSTVATAPVSAATNPFADTASNTSSTSTEKAGSLERHRSTSVDENDWQLIDKQHSGSTENLIEAPSTATAAASAAAPLLDFEQLSLDLKQHVEAQQVEQAAKKEALLTSQAIATATAAATPSAPPAAIVTDSAPAVAATTAPTTPPSTPAPTPAPRPKTPEEKRAVPVFHTDQRINNAIIAMMGMGFSNEGAWLTQLLESVNGNIPEALDLMTAAQRQHR